MNRFVRLPDPAQRQTKRFLFIQIMSHSLLLPVYHAFTIHISNSILDLTSHLLRYSENRQALPLPPWTTKTKSSK